MSEFPANIRLTVDDTQALRALKNFENKLNDIIDPRTKQALQNLLNVQKDRQAFTAEKQERREASQYAARKKKALLEEIRLTNALELQESRRIKLQRAGAFDVGSRAKAIQKLDKISAANPKDAAIQERVATSLSRILTTQNELNRAENKSVGQKQRIADYNKRIERLRELGVSEGKLRKALKRRAEFITAADRRQTTVADRRELQLKRELRLLEDVEKAARTVTRPGTLSGGARSPVGGSANTPGSPKYIDAQASAAAKAAKELDKVAAAEQKRKQAAGGARSPVRGAADIPGSPKYVEAQAAATAKAVKELDKVAAAEQRRNQAAGGARSPVRGSVDTPGSPKYLEAQAKALDKVAAAEQKRNQAAGGARSPLRGSANTPGSPKYLEAQAKAIEKLAKAGGPSSPLGKRSVLGSDESLRKKAEYYERVSKAVKPLSSPMRPQSVLGSDAALRKKAEYYERINRAIKGPASSLKDAPARTVLDSNNALKQKAAYYERIARKSTNTKTNSAATAKNTKATATNIERAAKSAKRLATGLKGAGGKKGEGFLNFGKGQTNLAAGVGFPLLFGGGPGSVIGGGLGALAGGFGGSIIGGAIGTQLDKLGAAALSTADAFEKLGSTASDLIPSLGRGAGGGFGGQAQFLIDEGSPSQVAEILRERFAEVYGDKALKEFEKLAEQNKKFKETWQEIGVELQRLLAGPLGGFLKALQGISNGLSGRGNDGVEERRKLNATYTELQKQANAIIEGGGQLSLAQKTKLENARLASAGASPDNQTSLTDDDTNKKTAAEEKLVDLVNQKKKIEEAVNKDKLAALEQALTARRDELAILNTAAGITRATTDLANTRKELEAERNAILKDTLKIAQLEKTEAEQAADLERQRVAQANAVALAERQIRQDLRGLSVEAFNLDKQITTEKAKQLSLTATASGQATIRNALILKEYQTTLDTLALKKAIALEGVNEIERQQQITANFKKQEELAFERAKAAKLASDQAETLRLIGEEQYKQQLKINTALAEQNALRSIQANDASRTLGFDAQGFGFFGDSFKLEADLFQKYNDDIDIFNRKIADVKANLEELTPRDINDGRADVFLKQLNTLQVLKSDYERLQPEINAAALEQQRFNDALAAVTPGVNALVGGLQEVVAGTKTAEEAFADFLRTVADQLVQTAAVMIAQYIAIGIAKAFAFGTKPSISDFGGGTPLGPLSGNTPLPFITDGLATGGTANGGQPYIVGENGPELFIPGVTGTVSNNDQFEAARDALSSGNVDGAFNENGEALGAISTAVQRSNSSAISSSFRENNATLSSTSSYMKERAMERESLTNIGDAGSMVVETQVINNVEYATVEQMQIATAASAKRARAQVFADLKNKPATRASIGMR